MTQGELVTKDDLERMKAEILAAIRTAVKPPENNVLSFDAACEYLGGMKAGTLRAKCSQGLITFHKSGRKPVFYRQDLDRYLDMNVHRSNDELRRM